MLLYNIRWIRRNNCKMHRHAWKVAHRISAITTYYVLGKIAKIPLIILFEFMNAL